MRISDWSSDVCSSDLAAPGKAAARMAVPKKSHRPRPLPQHHVEEHHDDEADHEAGGAVGLVALAVGLRDDLVADDEAHRAGGKGEAPGRSEKQRLNSSQ